MDNLVDCLEHWAHTQPETTLFNFLDGKGNSREQYTFRQFYERALALSEQLARQAELQYGDRALLVYPPGLEMMVGFFACLNLGVIPVPVCAPMTTASRAAIGRIEHVAQDCGARVALTTASYLRGISDAPAAGERGSRTVRFLVSLKWLATDDMLEPGADTGRRQINPILFLQYTSGSTGDPKGVIVTHRNVFHNALSGQYFLVGVSWVPQYHDMGLIGHHLFAVVLGGTNHAFSPFDFLKRPALWLQTISRVRATSTAAPNFAYDYCLREDKVPDAALCDVDLSSLKMMMNGAEPVHPQTYARFYERFSKYGLPREAFEVAYGLAENTLVISRRGRQTITVQKQRLQQGRLCFHKTMSRNNNHLSLVSCGQPLPSLDVRIVDPESHVAFGENAIGEIWVDGESKCAGYWQRPELTQSVFHARIEGEPHTSRTYLRTGDLGFLHEGELFVCGRIKDMIIIHGSNYYPQDIEAIVESEFPNIGPLGPVQTAAFAVEHEGEERLVVAIEVRPNQELADPAAVAQVIRSRYFIDPYQVLFVPPRAISTTTAGKVARSKTRDRWLRGTLPVLASYVHADSGRKDTHSLRGLYDHIRELYALSGNEEVTLADIGLDSLTLVDLTLEIQGHFERRGLAELVSELDVRFLQRLTVAELSRLLAVYEAGSDVPVDELRIWLEARQQADDDRECKLMRADSEWHPPTDSPEEARVDPQTILMTGGSGFFGPFLLGSLLQRTTCAIEVLVRAADPEHGRARLVDALRRTRVWTPELGEQFLSRVRVVCGDLGLSQLGLNDREWQRLAGEIDAVVHNGAQVNYVLSYDALRPYNIGGTRELMRLAATNRKKPFHLISSTFIHGWSARPIAAEHEYNENLEELDFGYSQSKTVQEHLVLNAERQGQPVRIYRPTLISTSSRGAGSKDDVFVRMLAFMIKHGIAAEALNQISLLPADLVSDHIARIFGLRDTASNTFHVTTTKYYNIIDITRSITEQFGYSFKYCSMARFIEEMNRLCTPDDLIYPLRVFFNRSYHKLKPMEPKRYDNQHYRAALGRVRPEIVEPKMPDTVAYIVKHMQREGLIPVHASARSAVPEPSEITWGRGISLEVEPYVETV
jgi:thioester reductase-like protein